MEDQKLENLLNLALDATEEEREKSVSLDVGYDAENRTWQVIVRHSGALRQLIAQQYPDVSWQITELSGGYAIVDLPQKDLNRLVRMLQVFYVEKPKQLFFSTESGRRASCLSSLQTGVGALSGAGVLVAVIDSGVDYFHPDFRTENGRTRIVALWDQSSSSGRAPDGFLQGCEYTQEQIDAALATGSREQGYALVPEQDLSGHGTAVLGIAAGNGRASGGRYRGVAPESPLLVVKLATPQKGGFPRTTELMQAVEYVVQKAEQMGMPVAVNLSFGSVYGSHRGNTLLETYLDQMANRWKSTFVIGTGNEADSDGHAAGRLPESEQTEVQFTVGEAQPALSIQIWKNYVDSWQIVLLHPDGSQIAFGDEQIGTARYLVGGTEILVYYGMPAPYLLQQEIFIELIPNGSNVFVDSGLWSIRFYPVQIVDGRFSMWMSDARTRNMQTRFLRPTPDATLTIPSAASRTIAVGAYDARTNSYAPFSGRGWPNESYPVHPDLVAPGVDVTAPAVRGGYLAVTGTSFATPFVTGSAALLMQWGIVNGNDPYLYGEKLRASLHRGARPLSGFRKYPNEVVGYGALCTAKSLPQK